MKTAGTAVLIIGIAAIPIACEHDDGGSSPSGMETDAHAEQPQSDRTRSSAPPTGIVPFRTLLEGSEFTDSFDAVIRSREELTAVYLSHDLRADSGAITPAWDQVDFERDIVIYLSLGKVIANKATGYRVTSMESTGEELIVHTSQASSPFCPPETFVTNYIGHVVVADDHGLPIEFELIEPLAVCL